MSIGLQKTVAREAASAQPGLCCFAARVGRTVKPAAKREPSDEVMRRVLAQSVHRYRLKRRWSIKTLAARSRLAPNCIGEIEQGTRKAVRLGIVESLARALEVDVARLLTLPPDFRGGQSRRIKGIKDRLPKRPVPLRAAPRYQS